MPLYEYQCTQCGERVEVIQRLSDPPYSHCPKCSGDMKKLFSAPAIQFKGSGWYKTDYASSKPAEKKSDAVESKPASESSTTKSETKSSE
jgi:putative FmdB family regulatory protein